MAAYEPNAPEVVGEAEAVRVEEAFARVMAAAEQDRLVDAGRIFVEFVANDDELAAVDDSDYLERTARYVPVLLEEIEQQTRPEAFSPTDPAVLQRISVPVLLLYGSETALRWSVDGVRHVAEHVADPEVRELAGLGHAGPTLGAQAVAVEFVRFFTANHARA